MENLVPGFEEQLIGMKTEEEKEINVTLSLGIYEMQDNDSDEDLLKKADKALYHAKNTGRNKVVVHYE